MTGGLAYRAEQAESTVAGMKIAVIGKGNIGGTLGTKWRAAGHDVVYGAGDDSGVGPGGAQVRRVGGAVEDAEVVVLAVPGQAVHDVLKDLGAALGQGGDRPGEPDGRF
jgi:8-hydroxy-5-deazaflavin:NADPH oxidoreductase